MLDLSYSNTESVLPVGFTKVTLFNSATQTFKMTQRAYGFTVLNIAREKEKQQPCFTP